MNIWIGTTNKGKLAEMTALFRRDMPTFEVHSSSELDYYVQPPEDGKTFLDNARIKARSMKAIKPGEWVIAEDTGLEVEALGGLPGIHTARYAGPHARDSENVAKLLKMLQIRNATTRAARFVCCMIAFDPQGAEHVVTTEMKGQIGKTPVGQLGFGYDPVFVPEGEAKTLAELGSAFKNAHSHRAKATLAIIEIMKAQAKS